MLGLDRGVERAVIAGPSVPLNFNTILFSLFYAFYLNTASSLILEMTARALRIEKESLAFRIGILTYVNELLR